MVDAATGAFKHQPRDGRDDELLFDCFLNWQSRGELKTRKPR
jgi:hypothetical protein